MGDFRAVIGVLLVGWVLVALVSTGCGASASDVTPTPKEYGTGGGPIEVVVAQEFIITLEANHTTGYQWQLAEPLNEKVAKLVGSVYSEPNTDKVGAGGTESWTFEAVGSGATKIVLNYVRPWEKGVAPAATEEFSVQVQ
jgi:inhibitor of cysteine peptidase